MMMMMITNEIIKVQYNDKKATSSFCNDFDMISSMILNPDLYQHIIVVVGFVGI